MSASSGPGISRRQLLTMIGLSAGSSVMYQAMHSLGFAADSSFQDPIRLGSAPAGASVLVLGAGIAGMVAALELRNATDGKLLAPKGLDRLRGCREGFAGITSKKS